MLSPSTAFALPAPHAVPVPQPQPLPQLAAGAAQNGRVTQAAALSVCSVAVICRQSNPKRRTRGSQKRSSTCRVATRALAELHLVDVVDAGDGKGLGLVAPNGAAAGAVLVDEEPVFRRPAGLTASDQVQLVKELSPEKRACLLSMAASKGDIAMEAGWHDEDLTALRAIRTNSVALPDGGGAVYGLSCRANHSCRPNASLCVGPDARMKLRALRDIAPGEDVLVSYIGEGDLLRSQSHRQHLIDTWGFECDCERCVGPDDTRGFQCVACGEGVMNVQPSDTSGTRWGPCDCCEAVLPSEALAGAEQEWVQHISALRPGPMRDAMAAAMHEGLVTSLADDPAAGPALDAHWVSAKLAGLAAEELIRRGEGPAAVEAGSFLRRYVRRTLGPVASRATAQMTCVEADAAVQSGRLDKAEHLYKAALREASLLPRTADKLIAEINEKKTALSKLVGVRVNESVNERIVATAGK
eukprot:gb/GFBE01008296.1/.p1 GENE.gb/GFBE01008296.1/~~gb/GFBE01008296.1/.p1  ORF type:complete len:470 (+),score=90.85 gb/GFBE01008296.1/:1-1410(+)